MDLKTYIFLKSAVEYTCSIFYIFTLKYKLMIFVNLKRSNVYHTTDGSETAYMFCFFKKEDVIKIYINPILELLVECYIHLKQVGQQTNKNMFKTENRKR